MTRDQHKSTQGEPPLFQTSGQDSLSNRTPRMLKGVEELLSKDLDADGYTDAVRKLRGLLSIDTVRSRGDYRLMDRLSARIQEFEERSEQPWCDKDTAELTAMLAEYQSLRQESLSTINSRANLIVLGLAAMAALFGGSLSIGEPSNKTFLTIALFNFVIPVLSLLILVLWVGEGMRLKRVSDYIATELEARVNRRFGRLVISWEAYLKTGTLKSDGWTGPSMFVFLLVSAIAFASPIVGVMMAQIPVLWFGVGWPLWQLWVPWLLGAGTIWFLVMHLRRIDYERVVSSVHLSPTSAARRKKVGN